MLFRSDYYRNRCQYGHVQFLNSGLVILQRGIENLASESQRKSESKTSQTSDGRQRPAIRFRGSLREVRRVESGEGFVVSIRISSGGEVGSQPFIREQVVTFFGSFTVMIKR